MAEERELMRGGERGTRDAEERGENRNKGRITSRKGKGGVEVRETGGKRGKLWGTWEEERKGRKERGNGRVEKG